MKRSMRCVICSVFLFSLLVTGAGASFVDQDSIKHQEAVNECARGAMMWAVGEQVISGTTSTALSPKAKTNRAEIAAIIMRYIQNF